jgi:hypothetical protein
VRLQKSRPLVRGTEAPKWLELHNKSSQYPLPLDAIHFRMCGVTVYEISRLVVLGRNNPSPYTVKGRPLYVHLNGLAIVLLK